MIVTSIKINDHSIKIKGQKIEQFLGRCLRFENKAFSFLFEMVILRVKNDRFLTQFCKCKIKVMKSHESDISIIAISIILMDGQNLIQTNPMKSHDDNFIHMDRIMKSHKAIYYIISTHKDSHRIDL